MPLDKRTKKLRFSFDIQILFANDFTITADHVSSCFELLNGISQNFSNLTAGLSYIFYVETIYSDK